jgi:hypothetical protein
MLGPVEARSSYQGSLMVSIPPLSVDGACVVLAVLHPIGMLERSKWILLLQATPLAINLRLAETNRSIADRDA